MKVKWTMLVEANGNTGLYTTGGANAVTRIGTGAALYEMLTRMSAPEVLGRDTEFAGVELCFFKDNFQYYNRGELEKYVAENQFDDAFFTRMMFQQFAQKNQDLFSSAWQGDLCTKDAIQRVLTELAVSHPRTGFVFVSDTPTVFSRTGDYIPPKEQLPALSVFCVNQSAVIDGSRFISSFQSDNNEVMIIDYASVQDNLGQAIASFIRRYPDAAITTRRIVEDCLEQKYGVAYSLYDAVKNSFTSRHSYASDGYTCR